MSKKLLAGAAFALGLAGLVSSAGAVPVTADLGGSGGTIASPPGLTYNLGGGLILTVTGHTHTGSGNTNAPLPGIANRNMYQTDEGVGVYGGSGDSDQLDGSGTSEMLRFTFNQAVNLLSVIFEDVGDNDQFDLGVDGVDIGIPGAIGSEVLEDFPGGGISGDDDRLVDFSGANLTGFVFEFYTNSSGDDYRIRKITAEAIYNGNGNGDSVPEPGTLALIGLGLTGLGLARRRQKS